MHCFPFLVLLIQVLNFKVSCDLENEKRLLEEYDSKLFVLHSCRTNVYGVSSMYVSLQYNNVTQFTSNCNVLPKEQACFSFSQRSKVRFIQFRNISKLRLKRTKPPDKIKLMNVCVPLVLKIENLDFGGHGRS